MQVPADLHQINAQLLCWSQAGLVQHRIWPRGPDASSAWDQQQPPASLWFLSMGIMHCNKRSPTHGWDGGSEEGGFLSLSPEEFALNESHVRHVVAGTELQFTCVARWIGRGHMENKDVVLPAMHISCSACGTTLCFSVINRPEDTFFS